MSYDRADWHYGGDFPADLPHANGGTHIGMFLAWAIINGLESEDLKEDSPAALAAVRARRMTGCQSLFKECDEKFSENDLTDEGNAFAVHYYESRDERCLYIEDYVSVLGDDVPSMYHITDSWQNYDRIAPLIDQRFAEWKRQQ